MRLKLINYIVHNLSKLRELFSERSIVQSSNIGVFGSSDTKDKILSRELDFGDIQTLALFLVDSKYDYASARKAEWDWLFISS